MAYFGSKNVICIDRFKTAALYFDRVIPIELGVAGQALIPPGFGPREVDLKSLSAKKSQKLRGSIQISYSQVWEVVFGSKQNSALDARNKWCDYVEEFCGQLINAHENLPMHEMKVALISSLQGNNPITSKAYYKFLQDMKLQSASLFLPSDTVPEYDKNGRDIMLTISQMPLVDAENASFEQICEFRNDDEARHKLRNFRLFLSNEYEEKALDYIEDDIAKRMDDYVAAAKKHGFDVFISSMQCIIDSKNIQTVLAGGLLALLFGGPITAISTAATIEVASVMLTLAKQIKDYTFLRDQHELAYIMHAKKYLKK